MELSKLEEDFVGDLVHDDHGVFEVFYFTRLHHPAADEEAVFRIGRELIETWIARGWLQVAKSPAGDSAIERIEQLSPLLEREGPRLMHAAHDSVWIGLTDRARADVPFLRGEAR